MRSGTSIIGVIKKGASQTKIHNRILGRLHADILGPEWTYVRTVAVPMVPTLDPGSLCPNCRTFVLDWKGLNNGVKDWLAACRGPALIPRSTEEYTILLTRYPFHLDRSLFPQMIFSSIGAAYRSQRRTVPSCSKMF